MISGWPSNWSRRGKVKKTIKVVGVIPARGGSKGIPRKNLKPLAGKPLIAYILEAALQVKTLDRVIVSTEDEEIAAVAKGYGAEVPFLRPRELAGDEVSIIPVVRHTMEYLDGQGYRPDIMVSLQPTAPLIEPGDIENAVNKLIETGCDSVVSVCQIARQHPYWAMKLERDRLVPLYAEGFRFLQRQDLPHLYSLTGAIYVRRRELIEKWRGHDFALGVYVRAVILDEEKSIDINDPLDFRVAEAILKGRVMVSE
jgi:CMP-N,N'-diacetyllegionaminic acid synthase